MAAIDDCRDNDPDFSEADHRADVLVESLVRHGVEVCSLILDGCRCTSADACRDRSGPFLRRRAGGIFAAEGYARHRQAGRRDGDLGPELAQLWLPGWPTPRWTRSRWWPSPARCPVPSSVRMRSQGAPIVEVSRQSQASLPGSARPGMCGSSRRHSTWRYRPARARCWIDIPKDVQNTLSPTRTTVSHNLDCRLPPPPPPP